MSAKVTLSLPDIAARLKQTPLPRVDSVIGVATGGIVPASLVAYQLECPLSLLHVNYRAEDNTPRYAAPRLLLAPTLPAPVRQVLLVDDVSVSGQTLAAARAWLAECAPGVQVTTLVLKGRADFVLFPEVGACVNWPWKLPS